MSRYRRQNRVIALKQEAIEGEHSAPTLAADALRVENPVWDFESETEETNETQDGLDEGDPIPIVGPAVLGFDVRLRGIAAPGTDVPEWDAVMRAMGFVRADLAADAVGTAQAGAAQSITLAADDAAPGNAYRGFVIAITAGTGAGQRNIVTGNDAGTKIATVLHAWTVDPDATSEYVIHKGSVYRPASQGLHCFSARSWDKARLASMDARLVQGEGMVADGALVLAARRVARLQGVRFRGRLASAPINVADPGPAAFAAGEIQPSVFKGATVRLGSTPIAFNTMTVNIGAGAEMPDDPAAAQGYGPAGIVRRRTTFSIDPMLELLSTLDAFADWDAGTKRAFSAIWGPPVAGRRLALACPGLMPTRVADGDNRGFTTTPIEGRCTGDDSGVWLGVF
jgi:hypothetical protein